jgi:transposase
MSTQLATTQPGIIAGVDAHKDTHHVVVLDSNGRRLGDREFPVTATGYQQLLGWVSGFGTVTKVGLESTGSYAAGLTRFLLDAGIDVREVNTPHAHTRAHRGKNDAIDAEAAARKALAGEAAAHPKTTTGTVEAIRLLTLARSSAVKARAVALTQLQDILITVPASLRERITRPQWAWQSCAVRPSTP